MPDVRTLLLRTLPDLRKEPEEHLERLVQGVTHLMQTEYHDAYQDLGIERAIPAAYTTLLGLRADGGYRYAQAEATHERLRGTGRHRFTGSVPMVFVDLPDKLEGGPETSNPDWRIARTLIGDVLAGDHKLWDLEQFRTYYQAPEDRYLDFEIGRVELLTPARVLGCRFAAVAVYQVYDTDGVMRAFVFEGGMATGQPRVLYTSPDGHPIEERRAGYRATPFSSYDHLYSGHLIRSERHNTLRGWVIEVREAEDAEPFFRLSVELIQLNFDRLVEMDPRKLVLQAALRVAAIAHARGEEIDDIGPLTGPLGALGRQLFDWTIEPGGM